MDTIRKELIEKYITLGHSEEHASREVNYFLEDAERSKQYVEMRRIAMARGNDLGIENIVQFAAAFLVGMVGSWALESLHAQGTVMLYLLSNGNQWFRLLIFFLSLFLRLLPLMAVSLGCPEAVQLRYPSQ